MLYYFWWLLGYKEKVKEIEMDILCINSFAPTNRDFQYVIEVYENEDDVPPPRINRVYYNH